MMDMFYHLHKAQNMTTVLVTHYMEHALKYADHVIILNKSNVDLEGKPTEVFTQKSILQKVKLDIPEVMQFLNRSSEKFPRSISYEHQSLHSIPRRIQSLVNGAWTS